jgi:hypothetical protein
VVLEEVWWKASHWSFDQDTWQSHVSHLLEYRERLGLRGKGHASVLEKNYNEQFELSQLSVYSHIQISPSNKGVLEASEGQTAKHEFVVGKNYLSTTLQRIHIGILITPILHKYIDASSSLYTAVFNL